MTTQHLIGIDVGGTKIAAATVTAHGAVNEYVVRATPAAHGPDAVLDAITAAVESLPDWQTARGIGVGTGGVVDPHAGTVVSANDLLPGWAGTHIHDELRARLQLPVAADNDVNAFALGEHLFGAGQTHTSALYVSVGTGIGGAIVLDGELHHGAHSTAGELGHIAVPEAVGRHCNCGRAAHLEAIASGPAISAYYRELTGTADNPELPEIVEQVTTGDPMASRAIEQGATALGRVLGGLVNTLDVDNVVLGGGVPGIGELYWNSLRTAFTAELLPAPSSVTITPAALGSRSAVVGAAALMLDKTTHRHPWDEHPGKAQALR